MEPRGWPALALAAFSAHAADSAASPPAAQPPLEVSTPTTTASPAGPQPLAATADTAPPPDVIRHRQRRRLRCLLLNDTADPGYPSFPIIALADHLALFDTLLPPGLFVNQSACAAGAASLRRRCSHRLCPSSSSANLDSLLFRCYVLSVSLGAVAVADPFLAELYRRLGARGLAPGLLVRNATGGIQLPDDRTYSPPRYARTYPRHEDVLCVRPLPSSALRAAWRPAATCQTRGLQRFRACPEHSLPTHAPHPNHPGPPGAG